MFTIFVKDVQYVFLTKVGLCQSELISETYLNCESSSVKYVIRNLISDSYVRVEKYYFVDNIVNICNKVSGGDKLSLDRYIT
jgi:hypothetical protein